MSNSFSTAVIDEKYQKLLELLRSLKGVVVAFSGGVDSTLLVAAAHEALGENALAVTATSPSMPRREYDEAVELIHLLGARHLTVQSQELRSPDYQRNPPERCFICKKIIFQTLLDVAAREKLPVVVEGSNADDLKDYRPGRAALAELGVRSPLLEVGLTKAEIRQLLKQRNLPGWDKPSLACLASRIPYDTPITEEKLRRIDQAEEFLRAQGFIQVRVRDHGEVARIEVEAALIGKISDEKLRISIVAELKRLGFAYVTVDLQGYRTGALNETL